jgi:HPt (histidine-containing phosphotransfer) domain-containing protein
MNVPFSPDFSQYDAIFGDDPPSYKEFLEALKKSLEKSMTNLEKAALTEDWNVISATRHSLKPTLTLLGAQHVNDILEEWRPSMHAIEVASLHARMIEILEAVEVKSSRFR